MMARYSVLAQIYPALELWRRFVADDPPTVAIRLR
jgi:hypothetical protein